MQDMMRNCLGYGLERGDLATEHVEQTTLLVMSSDGDYSNVAAWSIVPSGPQI